MQSDRCTDDGYLRCAVAAMHYTNAFTLVRVHPAALSMAAILLLHLCASLPGFWLSMRTKHCEYCA
jgi:hypothetical protein